MLALPYRFVVPLPIKENELLDFSAQDWEFLQAEGFEVIDLTPEQVTRASSLRLSYGKLSLEDCFSLALAECFEASILLTGDAALKTTATQFNIESHGVLWVVDQLQQNGSVHPHDLAKCLEIWRDDPLNFVPANLITSRLRLLR
ncbi:PIN domain-containing protein [Rhodoplanes roseus]|uniref:PIN domain-containing protein n=1 Tax=Rhodoplanes roseus TaxID=29409 RepID=A0A327L215_9BRAD|nr:PIN domain-containing protein [Rhodoplanes roseus]RAI43522.1 hypothetical protein CH341_13870 [Rhodoplanes roseus]